MKEKKSYSTPSVKTEKIEVGVFGCYGGGNGNKPAPVKLWNPFFGWCCS